MKKFFIGFTIAGMIFAAFYLANRMPSAPPVAPTPVAERPLEMPPVPTAQNEFPVVNQERIQRLATMKTKGPSPIEHYQESELMMAAQKLKANDRVPANEPKQTK